MIRFCMSFQQTRQCANSLQKLRLIDMVCTKSPSSGYKDSEHAHLQTFLRINAHVYSDKGNNII